MTTSVLLGGVATSYHNRRWRSGDDESLPGDAFWLAEPELQLETNVTSALRIGIGGSYRFVHGARLQGVTDRDFRGASGAVTLTFGRIWSSAARCTHGAPGRVIATPFGTARPKVRRPVRPCFERAGFPTRQGPTR